MLNSLKVKNVFLKIWIKKGKDLVVRFPHFFILIFPCLHYFFDIFANSNSNICTFFNSVNCWRLFQMFAFLVPVILPMAQISLTGSVCTILSVATERFISLYRWEIWLLSSSAQLQLQPNSNASEFSFISYLFNLQTQPDKPTTGPKGIVDFFYL